MRQTERTNREYQGLTADDVYQMLRNSPHLRGRGDRLHISVVANDVTIRGVLPNFYLRQVLNSVLNRCDDVAQVIDLIDVVSDEQPNDASPKAQPESGATRSVRRPTA